MSLPRSLSGHGTYIYQSAETVAHFGTATTAAVAIRECGMTHAWVRIHGRNYIHNDKATKELIAALREAGVAVAGWGWCQGENPAAEAKLALKALTTLELTEYVADIEHGVSQASWSTDEIEKFFTALRASPQAPRAIALSTHGFIDWHAPELMKAADPFVDLFAPQTYWFRAPTMKMLRSVGASSTKYPLDNSASYVALCLDRWRKLVTKPLLAAGQAYTSVDESVSFDATTANEKVRGFLTDFQAWDRLAGLNWWYFSNGSRGSMTPHMRLLIREANLSAHWPAPVPAKTRAMVAVAAAIAAKPSYESVLNRLIDALLAAHYPTPFNEKSIAVDITGSKVALLSVINAAFFPKAAKFRESMVSETATLRTVVLDIRDLLA